jgi:ABC-2 type transport system permease protein
MYNSWLIAFREFKERVANRSFIILSILGPLLVLGLIYLLFTFGGKTQKHWNVLVIDPAHLLNNQMLSKEDKSITYSFGDAYLETKDFEKGKRFQKFDAFLEVNEKILTNKTAFVFYREKPSSTMKTRIQYHCERRLEELLVKKFTKFSIGEFRKIKQPLTVGFRNVYDPNDTSSDVRGWVGLFYGAIIFVFIFLFGMTILRSTSKEKSNRIVEVLLGSVSPKQLMFGKITGIGLAAFLQFIIWTVVIGLGLFFLRENFFLDSLDSVKETANSLMETGGESNQFFENKAYNQFVELVYERINFTFMTGYFLVFFVLGYFFYGSLFASIGAASGSESDGQQFVLPLLFLLIFALYSGYYSLENPESTLAHLFEYLPFTSPIVIMVKLSMGYATGKGYELYLSILTLILSTIFVLNIAGRIYSNGILQFGHRVRFKLLWRWMKKQ